MKKFVVTITILLIVQNIVFLQESENGITLDFRNQRISDILLSLAEITDETIVYDETVTGNATFFFADIDLNSALERFADYARLYIEKRNDMYYISKIKTEVNATTNNISVYAEDVYPEALLKEISRKTNITIFYDALPVQAITVRATDVSIEEVLRLIITKYPEYEVKNENGGFYVSKTTSQNTSISNRLEITSENDVFSVVATRTNLNDIIKLLFSKAAKEFSLLNKSSVVLENLFFQDKSFEQMLTLILEQANSDFQVIDSIYYIFEIQKNDVLKKLKTTRVLPLKHVSAENIISIFPPELNVSSFTRVDKEKNTLYITGSEQQIAPLISFINEIDIPLEGRYYAEFVVKNIEVSEAIQALPEGMLFSQATAIPRATSFVAQVTAEKEIEIRNYLNILDVKSYSEAVHLNYIKSEELLQYLPPSVTKDNILITGDPSLIFYVGSQENYSSFFKELELIDQPKKQIRYQILVIQYQKTDSFNFETGITLEKTDSPLASLISGEMTNLLNIQFDIISQLGFQFAAKLNLELGENRASILADTTLNGISGEKISFENTNTYRYRDVIVDPDTGVYSGETREISSGLLLDIEGWVSGDEMITVNINTQISKQGLVSESSGSTVSNPPSTSEKTVTTSVRTKSGTPVVIGGLLQSETDTTVKKPPLLGFMIKDEGKTEATTEMIIYLVPFVEKQMHAVAEYDSALRSYYTKYVEE